MKKRWIVAAFAAVIIAPMIFVGGCGDNAACWVSKLKADDLCFSELGIVVDDYQFDKAIWTDVEQTRVLFKGDNLSLLRSNGAIVKYEFACEYDISSRQLIEAAAFRQ